MRIAIVRPAYALPALLLAVAWTTWTSAHAHEGEDHTSSQAGIEATGISPRSEAASENFELVAVARRERLTIYLDRLRSNDPVTGATVTVETPVGSVDASQSMTAPTRSPRPGRRCRAVMTSSSRLRATAQPRC